MNLLELLKAIDGQIITCEDGESYTFKLMPGLSLEKLDELEKKLPGPLPGEIRELLLYTSGIEEGPIHMVDFSGRLMWEFKEFFPFGHPIAQDGYGNYWIVDINPNSGDWSPIYYVCHDPLVVVYQAETVSGFVAEVLKLDQAGEKSMVDEVHETFTDKIWRENPGLIPVLDAREGTDTVLKDFAEGLDESMFIVDMREARVGDGFAWGKGGWSELHRYKNEPIFSFEQKKNLFQRLFGKK